MERIRGLIRSRRATRRPRCWPASSPRPRFGWCARSRTYFHLGERRRAGAPRARARRDARARAGGWLHAGGRRASQAAGHPARRARRRGAPARRAARVHRAPDRGGAAHRAQQAPPDRRPAGRRRRGDAGADASGPAARRSSTCCGRPTSCGSPAPTPSTRRATPSTTSTTLHADAVPDVLEELARRARAARPRAADPTRARSRSAAGSAATATATRTSRRTATRACSRSSTSTRCATRSPSSTSCARDLSSSVRIAGATPELRGSLAADLETLPEVEPRYRRLNAEEPYRLKLTCIQREAREHAARGSRRAPARGRPRLPAARGELLADLCSCATRCWPTAAS